MNTAGCRRGHYTMEFKKVFLFPAIQAERKLISEKWLMGPNRALGEYCRRLQNNSGSHKIT
jgi:hypothetical protein